MATKPQYTVVVAPAAARVLKKLKDRALAARLVAAMLDLETDPRPPGMKVLHAADGLCRIRVGDYRILYSIADDVLTIEVVTIGHRRDVYRAIKG